MGIGSEDIVLSSIIPRVASHRAGAFRSAEITSSSPSTTKEMRLLGTIIVVASSKGGVSKSTSSALLAVNLSSRGYRTAIIDADRNGALAAWYANGYEGPALTCTSEFDHNLIVAHAMGQGEIHDVTVIDTAGFENQTALFAMGTADLVLIPIMADRNSVLEARKTARQCEGIAKLARREIPYRVLLSRWNRRGLAERATLEDLHASNLTPLTQHIPDLSDFQKATFTGHMPHTGTIGRYAHTIIDELIALGAIPAKPERRVA
jgi:chromosome partitioning protein